MDSTSVEGRKLLAIDPAAGATPVQEANLRLFSAAERMIAREAIALESQLLLDIKRREAIIE